METKIRAYGMIYALLFLLGISVFTQMSLRYFGTQADATSNFYGSFQNALYAKTIYQIASKCIQKYQNLESCQSNTFIRGIFSGDYQLTEYPTFYEINISILHQNPRNLHIIRNFYKKKIKRQENANT